MEHHMWLRIFFAIQERKARPQRISTQRSTQSGVIGVRAVGIGPSEIQPLASKGVEKRRYRSVADGLMNDIEANRLEMDHDN